MRITLLLTCESHANHIADHIANHMRITLLITLLIPCYSHATHMLTTLCFFRALQPMKDIYHLEHSERAKLYGSVLMVHVGCISCTLFLSTDQNKHTCWNSFYYPHSCDLYICCCVFLLINTYQYLPLLLLVPPYVLQWSGT